MAYCFLIDSSAATLIYNGAAQAKHGALSKNRHQINMLMSPKCGINVTGFFTGVTRLMSHAAPPANPALTFRSVFISDVHLGTKDARVEYLLDFLAHIECEYLFLDGDIFDIWKMKTSRWHWPLLNTQLLQRVMELTTAGIKVIYVPGNHDEFFRDYLGSELGGVQIHRAYRHTLADGRKALILHGDEFDGVVRHNRLLKWVGNAGYEALMALNRASTRIRRILGKGYWSLSLAIKNQVPNARGYIEKYEEAALRHAREQGVDVIVCGHIHHANLRTVENVTYANAGDWVEHCTAIVENKNGQLELIHWAKESAHRLDGRKIAAPRSHAAPPVVHQPESVQPIHAKTAQARQ
jgi:UDP-2,3-diacylglucosamine pyrophosphatase LpxH